MIQRAQELLSELEGAPKKQVRPRKKKQNDQMLLFSSLEENQKEKVLLEIARLDPNKLTPIESLSLIETWKSLLR